MEAQGVTSSDAHGRERLGLEGDVLGGGHRVHDGARGVRGGGGRHGAAAGGGGGRGAEGRGGGGGAGEACRKRARQGGREGEAVRIQRR